MRYLYAFILIDHSFDRGTRGVPVPHHPLLVRCYEHILVGPGYCGNVLDRKSTRLNSSHTVISYAVFCLKHQSTTVFYTLSLHDALPISSTHASFSVVCLFA